MPQLEKLALEIQGMSKAYRNTTKGERVLKRLPSLSSFMEGDETPSNCSVDQLREALGFAFMKLLRKNMRTDAYKYILNNKSEFTAILETFASTGNHKEMLRSLKQQLNYIVGPTVRSVLSSPRRKVFLVFQYWDFARRLRVLQ